MAADTSLNEVMARAEALEAENRRLREALAGAGETAGLSRRRVLAGGAGIVGALAGAGLLAGRQGAAEAARGIRLPQQASSKAAFPNPPIAGFIAIKGQKQGQFKGESTAAKRAGMWMDVIELNYRVSSPYDQASGQATGRRQHEPLTITKRWGAASPQIFEALVTNENLTSVQLEFVKSSEAGEEAVFYAITLTDARIVAYNPRQGNPLGDFDDAFLSELENVSFIFRTIEVQSNDGKTAAQDTWTSAT